MDYKEELGNSGTFRMEITDFKLIEKNTPRWPGKRLRFTIMWELLLPSTNPELGDKPVKLGMTIEGNLARCIESGEVTWNPPQSRSGSYYANYMFPTPDFYRAVQKCIEQSKYYKDLKPLITTAEIALREKENPPEPVEPIKVF